jgi:hypothetical protein
MKIIIPGCFDIPIFLMIGRHHPENCPMKQRKNKKSSMEHFGKQEGLLNKHGIKSLGSCTDYGKHLMVSCMKPQVQMLY